MPFYVEGEDPSKGVDVRVVAFQAKAGDACLPKKNVPGGFGRVCCVYKG